MTGDTTPAPSTVSGASPPKTPSDDSSKRPVCRKQENWNGRRWQLSAFHLTTWCRQAERRNSACALISGFTPSNKKGSATAEPFVIAKLEAIHRPPLVNQPS